MLFISIMSMCLRWKNERLDGRMKGPPSGSLYAQMDEQLERSFDRCYNLYERGSRAGSGLQPRG